MKPVKKGFIVAPSENLLFYDSWDKWAQTGWLVQD